ncbi:MAG: hypothetical protein ACRCT8_11965 [Lacipirellulaceae bacterium]
MSSSPNAALKIPEPGIEPDGLNTVSIVMWGLISCVVTFCVILASFALYFEVQNDLNQDRLVAPLIIESEDTINAQRELVGSYGPPSSEGAPYRIPVERARALVLRDLADK